MKITFTSFLFTSIVCLAAHSGFSQQRSLLVPEKTAKLDSFLQVMTENRLFNGSVLVSENGKIVYKRSAGYYNFEKKIFNSAKAQFNLASASKPFTALAILQLVQNQKISLDEPVAKYLPGFRFDNITIKNLLTHTSGLPRMEDVENDYATINPNEIISNDKVYRDLVTGTDTLWFQPGEKFQYNNTNYFLLSLIVERVSGMSFGNYMAKKIFEPAGMKDTYIRQGIANTPRYVLPTMYSTQYQHVDSLDKNKFYTYFQLGGITGSNNIVSTLEDLFLFDNALNGGKLVDLKFLNEAFISSVLNNGKKVSLGGIRTYGYGWNIMEEPVRDRVIFHDGHIPGLTTMILKNPAKKLTIFYYDNTESKGFFQKIGNISRILNDEPLNKIPLQKSAVRIFGETLVNQGLVAAKTMLDELRADSVHYYFDELEMNSLGYDLLSKGLSPEHKSLSLEVFKMNTLFFPAHPNVYDSYGEALLENGQKEEAIKMYKKVIELDPNHQTARKTLERLLQ